MVTRAQTDQGARKVTREGPLNLMFARMKVLKESFCIFKSRSQIWMNSKGRFLFLWLWVEIPVCLFVRFNLPPASCFLPVFQSGHRMHTEFTFPAVLHFPTRPWSSEVRTTWLLICLLIIYSPFLLQSVCHCFSTKNCLVVFRSPLSRFYLPCVCVCVCF